MWVCDKCKYVNSENYNFCNRCGSPKAQEKPSGKTWICTKCKTENWNNDQYCKSCRTPRNAKAEPSRNKNIILYGIIAALAVLVIALLVSSGSKSPASSTPTVIYTSAPAPVYTQAPAPVYTPAPVIEATPEPEPGPGPHDLEAIGSRIEYPAIADYFDVYYTATVTAEGWYTVPAYINADTSSKSFNVIVGEQVTVLAERPNRGLTCIIVPYLGRAGWIDSDYLVFD